MIANEESQRPSPNWLLTFGRRLSPSRGTKSCSSDSAVSDLGRAYASVLVNLSITQWHLLWAEHGYSLMLLTFTVIVVAFVMLSLVVIFRVKGQRDQRELEQHSITADELHALLASNQEVLLFDVRQPLDLLANSEIIPKAQRIPPDEVLQKPSLIPREKDIVVYCTCPGDKTSRAVLRRAVALHFSRVKLLKGGFAAWKAKGYPVEPYNEVFHLYSPKLTSLPR